MKANTVSQVVLVATIAIATSAASARIVETNGTVDRSEVVRMVGADADADTVDRVSTHFQQTLRQEATRESFGLFIGISETNG